MLTGIDNIFLDEHEILLHCYEPTRKHTEFGYKQLVEPNNFLNDIIF